MPKLLLQIGLYCSAVGTGVVTILLGVWLSGEVRTVGNLDWLVATSIAGEVFLAFGGLFAGIGSYQLLRSHQ